MYFSGPLCVAYSAEANRVVSSSQKKKSTRSSLQSQCLFRNLSDIN